MDDAKFDNITRALAAGASRRRLLKTVAGGLAGGLLGFSPSRLRAAPCRGAGRACTQHGNCCSGLCDSATKKCTCPAGTLVCRDQCVVPCPSGLSPNPTTCQCGCPGGTTLCGGACVTNCTGGHVLNGTCQCVCPSGTTPCDGACAPTCTGVKVLNGSCQCVCPAGTLECLGNCVAACSPGQGLNPATCQCDVPCKTQGQTCSSDTPAGDAECCSGICGCREGGGCFCRVAPCIEQGASCAALGTNSCCSGICSATSICVA